MLLIKRQCVQTILFVMIGYFDTSVFEITKVNCIWLHDHGTDAFFVKGTSFTDLYLLP